MVAEEDSTTIHRGVECTMVPEGADGGPRPGGIRVPTGETTGGTDATIGEIAAASAKMATDERSTPRDSSNKGTAATSSSWKSVVPPPSTDTVIL